jgi:hypothetical protein
MKRTTATPAIKIATRNHVCHILFLGCFSWFLVAGTLAAWPNHKGFVFAIAVLVSCPSYVFSCLAAVTLFAAAERTSSYAQIRWRLPALLAFELV